MSTFTFSPLKNPGFTSDEWLGKIGGTFALLKLFLALVGKGMIASNGKGF